MEISISAPIFKIDSHINLNQETKIKLSACNVTTVLLKLKKETNMRLFKIVLEMKGGVSGENVMQTLKILDVYCCKDLDALK